VKTKNNNNEEFASFSIKPRIDTSQSLEKIEEDLIKLRKTK